MTVVVVEIRPKSPTPPAASWPSAQSLTDSGMAEPVDIEVVEDMDQYVEHAMCSCNASDDNPY